MTSIFSLSDPLFYWCFLLISCMMRVGGAVGYEVLCNRSCACDRQLLCYRNVEVAIDFLRLMIFTV